MYRYELINSLIRKNNFSSYLQLGGGTDECFNQIEANNKVLVDVEQSGYTTHQMTADEFFEKHCRGNFDIIFIDDNHTSEHAYKNITNAIKHLSPNGYVICHDVNPTEEWMTERISLSCGWAYTGDVYKAFIKFRQNHLNYSCCVVEDDYGIGVITKGIGQYVDCDVDSLTFDEFINNKNYLLNIISAEKFIKLFLLNN